MPIYAYRCEHCGHAKDVLQKISDPVLSVCPACGQSTFRKQVTAAGFQLKGSGWYVTDFRGDKPAGKAADADGKADAKDRDAKPADAEGGDGAKAEPAKANGATDGAKAASPAAAPAAAPAAPSPAPVSGSGSAGGRQP